MHYQGGVYFYLQWQSIFEAVDETCSHLTRLKGKPRRVCLVNICLVIAQSKVDVHIQDLHIRRGGVGPPHHQTIHPHTSQPIMGPPNQAPRKVGGSRKSAVSKPNSKPPRSSTPPTAGSSRQTGSQPQASENPSETYSEHSLRQSIQSSQAILHLLTDNELDPNLRRDKAAHMIMQQYLPNFQRLEEHKRTSSETQNTAAEVEKNSKNLIIYLNHGCSHENKEKIAGLWALASPDLTKEERVSTLLEAGKAGAPKPDDFRRVNDHTIKNLKDYCNVLSSNGKGKGRRA